MFIKSWLLVFVCLPLGLVGCASTLGESTLSGNFDVPLNYRQAYQNARAQAQGCLLGNGSYRIKGALDEVHQGGVVSVVPQLFGKREVARVQIVAVDDAHARVYVSMWGKGLWDVNAMHAMHDAIVFGVSSCSTYMPFAKGDVWFKK